MLLATHIIEKISWKIINFPKACWLSESKFIEKKFLSIGKGCD